MAYIAVTVGLTVLGQLLVKKGMLEVGPSPNAPSELIGFIIRTLTNLSVVVGLSSAVGAAISWTIAISRIELSFAYPFTALGLVLVVALSGVLFGEAVPWNRWLGVAIVCLGLVVASRPL